MQKQMTHFLCVLFAMGFFSCSDSGTSSTDEVGNFSSSEVSSSSSEVVEAGSSSLVAATISSSSFTAELSSSSIKALNSFSSATLSSSSVVAVSSSSSGASSSSSGVVSGWCATAENCGTFTDDRESPAKTYKWTKIGTQTWMAENLNYTPSSGNSWCYNNQASFCTTYGRLYDWVTVMAGASSSEFSPSGVQGICPTGWHVPSRAEWGTLVDYVGGSNFAGIKLKSVTGWKKYNGIPITDDYGFSALPGGGYYGSDFYNVGNFGNWWSTTEGSATRAYGRTMEYNDAAVRSSNNDRMGGYSLRCAKD